ncbi:MAG TPA: MarC family protein [Kofleriaceae bacterium]|nr:MarC family protein [Kofleriaceae bacterium]
MTELIINLFVALLVVVDPVGLAPVFAGLTRDYSEQRKREAAIRGTLVGAAILVLFAVAGNGLLDALGIGIPAFRIAGGVLLFLTALDMIFARPSKTRVRTVQDQDDDQDVSVFPLAIPLIAGPGAITTVLLYGGDTSPVQMVAVVAVLAVVLALVLISLLLATRIMRLFGKTGANVLARVLGVLLAALAVQLIIDGILATIGS